MNFFNLSIYNILNRDQSIIDQARIRLLYYGCVLTIAGLGALFASVYLQNLQVMTYTTGILLVAMIALFKFFTYKPQWFVTSHILLAIGTLINLATVFVIVQEVNLVAIQIVILVVVFSFYMLGQRWGMFYSLLNLLPVALFMVMRYEHAYFVNFKPEIADPSTTIIAVFANFILIIFIQSHFYTSFIKNIKVLHITGTEQAELNAKFEKAIAKAEKSSLAQSEFLSTMSHEIRTPLNAVIGMSDLLIMNNPAPEQIENLEILKFSANNLLAIVNDVLDYSKIESGKVVFEHIKFNLAELLQNVCGGQIIKAEKKGLLFKLNIDNSLRRKLLFGDPTRLTQIVYNLISNAIKFTAKGNIWVDVTCVAHKHNSVTVSFSVKDTGIGIKEEDLQVIFEPFIQESISDTRQYGGTGLGLTIVKRLLELQGLHMQVNSQLGQGSEFSFAMDFPVAADSVAKRGTVNDLIQPAIAKLESMGSSLRVLIAEDNPVNVMLMKKLFSRWKIIPTIAENGERAVEMMQYGNYDIILMDLQMPVMNGFDASLEIRKMLDPLKANIPIIALTACALFDIKEQVQNAGMNDYVAKPFKPDELIEKIQLLVAI